MPVFDKEEIGSNTHSVCAPYHVLQNVKFKVEMVPGVLIACVWNEGDWVYATLSMCSVPSATKHKVQVKLAPGALLAYV